MVSYMQQLAQDLSTMINERQLVRNLERRRDHPIDPATYTDVLAALVEEIGRLDPRDFLPAAQHEFVMARLRLGKWKEKLLGPGLTDLELNQVVELANTINECLGQYGGEGSQAESRSFAFVSDTELRSIIERDYKELSLILLPGRAWKSCVVMAGSILEAILSDVLTRDPATKARAEGSPDAPRDGRGRLRDLDRGEWNLMSLSRSNFVGIMHLRT